MPLALLVALLGCGSPDEPASGIADSGETGRIETYLEPYLESRSFSGTLLVVRDGAVLHHRGYGLADVESGRANSTGTRFRIGSMSKSFTEAAILLLAERGLLGLDDPVSHHVEDFRHPAITVRQLLTHTSGLPRFVFQPDYGEREQRPHSTRELVDWIADRPLSSEPGSAFGYSNANYALLAHLIEQISGLAYGDFLAAEVLAPLGLHHTGHLGSADRVDPRLARGHTPVGIDQLEPARHHDYSIDTGSGSLVSTTGDLVAWHQARAAGRLLDEATRRSLAGAAGTPLGYAWNVSDRLGRQAVQLTGWDGVGFGVQFVHYPASSLSIAVLSNLNISSISGEIADGVAAILFGDRPEAPEILARPVHDLQTLRRYAGSYRFGEDFFVPGATIRFEERGGQLIVPAAPPAPEGGLLPLADGSFIHRQQWFRVRFEEEGDAVTGIRYSSFRAHREPSS